MMLLHKIRNMHNDNYSVCQKEYREKRLFFVDVSPIGFFIEATYEEMEELELKIYEFLYEMPMMSIRDLVQTVNKVPSTDNVLYSKNLGWGDTAYIKDGFFIVIENDRHVECVTDGNALTCCVLRCPRINRAEVGGKIHNISGGLLV